MAKLTDGTSDYTTTGTADTRDTLSNGINGTEVKAEPTNGLTQAVIALQTLLGNALTLKGNTASLVARLSKMIDADGVLPHGTVFPASPIEGQLYYRTDENIIYVYDAGSSAWTPGFDNLYYALLDGTRAFNGDVKIRKATPGVRLTGLEASAKDVLIRENAGLLYLYANTGTENAPTWTERAYVNMTNGTLWLGGTTANVSLVHSNTADRTYTLPDFNWDFYTGVLFRGPSSIGSGSTRSHEGTVTVSADGNYSGIHFYTDFTLDSGKTMTVPAGSGRLILIASGTITINGTISAVGGGIAVPPNGSTATPGASATGLAHSAVGGAGGGTASKGGTGGDTAAMVWFDIVFQAGAVGTTGTANGTSVTGSGHPTLANPFMDFGGGAGGAGAGDGTATGGNGGRGGGTIVLIAPKIVLASSATITTAGAAGTSGTGGTAGVNNRGGGGGGGGGDLHIITRSFTDNGATITTNGGAGGSTGAFTTPGGSGANGIKQILVYS